MGLTVFFLKIVYVYTETKRIGGWVKTRMTKKAKKTAKSKESHSKKPSQSSKTRTAPFRKTALKITTKQGSGSSGKVTEEESLAQKKKDAWEGYDDQELPEMTDEQLTSFKPVSKEQHLRFKKVVAEAKKMGRPPKPLEEKERVHAIRFSDHLLDALKAKAHKAGLRWQTYAKQILTAEINKTDKSDNAR